MTEHLRRHRHGMRAESWAAWWLRAKGYRLRAQRYKTPHGEIDLIASRGGILAFIEVKARADLETGMHAVSPVAQARIMAAARHFAARHARLAGMAWRFDVVVVRPRRLPYHLTDAWRVS